MKLNARSVTLNFGSLPPTFFDEHTDNIPYFEQGVDVVIDYAAIEGLDVELLSDYEKEFVAAVKETRVVGIEQIVLSPM